MKVVLGSTNKNKLTAVKKAFREIFPDKKIEVVGVKAKSGVNEQPVGHQETLKGARNRVLQAKKLAKDADFYIGLENGLVKIENNWFDIAWCMVIDKNNKKSLAPSAGVFFPKKYVNRAKKKGFETTTASMMLYEEIGQETKYGDPHTILTNKATSRSELMKQVIKIAIGQLNTKY